MSISTPDLFDAHRDTVSVADQCDRSVRQQLPTPQFFPNQNGSMIAFAFMCPAPPGEVLGETYDYHGTR